MNRIRLTRATIVRLVAFAAVLILGGVLVSTAAQADDPSRATSATVAAASAALGAPVPEVRYLPVGFSLRGVGIDAAASPHRAAHLAYGTQTKNRILLTVSRGTLTALDSQEQLVFDGASVAVSTKSLDDGTYDVSYAWNQGPFAIVLHVNLSNDVTRAVADRIAASVH